MNYLGHPQPALEAAGGFWTAREIAQQPAIWGKIERDMAREASVLRAFLDPLLARRDLRIVLTGAGTSAYVGECLASALKRRTQLRVDAVATTDLVGSPDSWLEPAVPTLLVSFARSGNSPESVAAVAIAEQGVAECHHLIVTCNAEGSLYRQRDRFRHAYAVLLPEETNDRGFAMTSSFTGMMLAASLAFDLAFDLAIDQALDRARKVSVAELAGWAREVLGARLPLLGELAAAGFDRVVYLGSQAFKGLAREAALKMLELSDGRIVALADTPLGFRHGPKTIVNERTLVVVLLGNEAYARRYDIDLLKELRADGVAGRVLALTAQAIDAPHADDVVLAGGAGEASDLALCLPYAVFAQVLAFLQSLALGLRPDVPNAGGTVSRVVKGVNIYPWDPGGST
jgi:tagatose-6-phosphate ketose/aldose isomerase